jgi:two-component system, sensor histidine kinase and response regulator
MPDIDGFTLAAQVRQDAQLRDAVIIVLTSGDRPDDKARGAELGVAAHLQKPIKQSELLDAIVLAMGVTEPEPDQPARRGDAPPALVPLRILLAEDAYPNQVLVIGLLGKQGHAISVANNGKEAVALLKAHPFDVVLMDVQMPEMDGLEATRLIRQLEATGQLAAQPRTRIPIVAMTAHAMKGDRERCLESGMDSYVTKPIRSRDLSEALAQFFPHTPAAAGGAERSTPSAVLDWPAALQSTDGDVDLLRIVGQAYLTEVPGHRARLRTAVAAKDAATVHRLGHLLKGLASTFGAAQARGLAERLETIGRDNDLTTAADCLAALEKQLDLLTDILTAFVDGRAGPTSQDVDYSPG